MTQYKCGHEQRAVIINTSESALAEYFAWRAENNGRNVICFKCWVKEKRGDV